jgi:adenosylcobinamide-GDP ribazoletransferase
MVVTLVAYGGLSSVPSVWTAILAGEVLARLGTAWVTVAGRPFREGIHATLHGGAHPVHGLYALLLALPLPLILPAGPLALSLLVTTIAAAGMVALGDRLFGGVNGDVAGAAHEITRALVVATLALAL